MGTKLSPVPTRQTAQATRPERCVQLQRQHVGVEGDEVDGQLAGGDVAVHALLLQHALARDRAPRQPEHRKLQARLLPAPTDAMCENSNLRPCSLAGGNVAIHALLLQHAIVRRGSQNAANSRPSVCLPKAAEASVQQAVMPQQPEQRKFQAQLLPARAAETACVES